MNSTKIKIFIKNKDRLIYKNNNKYYYRYDNRFININKNKLTDNFGVIGIKRNKRMKVWGGGIKLNNIKLLKTKISEIEAIQKKLDFHKNIVKYNHIKNINNIFIFLEKYRIILIQLIESKYGDDEDNTEFTKSIISSIKIILFDKIFLNYLVNIINYFIQDKDIDSVKELIDILTFKGNREIDNLLGEGDIDDNVRNYIDNEYEKKKEKIIETIQKKKEDFENECEKYIDNVDKKNEKNIENIENEEIVFDDDNNNDNELYDALKTKLITECYSNIKKSYEILRESVDIKKYWAILKDTAIYEITDTNIFKSSDNNYVLDILKYKKNVLIMINNILYKCISQNIKIFISEDDQNNTYYDKYKDIYNDLNTIISNISIIKDKDNDNDKTLIDNKINGIKNINEGMILKQLKYQSDLNNYFDIYNEFIEQIVNKYILNINIYYTSKSSQNVQPTKKILFINSVNIMTIFLKNLIFNIKENFNKKIEDIDRLFDDLQSKNNDLEN